MINTILFGPGKWGSILKKELEKISNLIKVFDSKSNYDQFDFQKINWAMVATNNINHFSIVNFLIENKVNIFCEKPLTLSSKESFYLIEEAKKNNVKLYINHIYNFKNIKIKLEKKNYIYRSKISKKNLNEILYDLTYHDIYLLYPYIDLNNLEFINIEYRRSYLEFSFISKSKEFFFKYDCENNKNHFINKINLIDNENVIPKVFNNVFNNKTNFTKNNLQAIHCNLFIEKLIDFFYTKKSFS